MFKALRVFVWPCLLGLSAAGLQAELGWRWENPRPTSDHLQAVWGSSPDDVYAVGSSGTVVHFDGSSWSLVFESWADFESVHGSGPDDVWVAGTVVVRFDGESWSRVETDPYWFFNGIWVRGPGDVFAVGYRFDLGRGIVVHFDGTGWTEVVSSSNARPTAIWGTGSELFVVGRFGEILHFDGTQWEVQASGTSVELLTVWGTSADNVFAAGYSGVLRFDGKTWSRMSGAPREYVTSLHVSPGDALYVVEYGGSIHRFDGSVWHRESATDHSTLFGVWSSGSGRAVAVGSTGRILEREAGGWRERSQDVRGWLPDVWTDGEAAFAVGNDSRLNSRPVFLRRTAEGWQEIACWSSRGPGFGLYAVWGTDAENVWAAGQFGFVFHYDGDSCAVMNLPTSASFFDLWGASSDDIYLVGDENWHFDGLGWQQLSIGTEEPIYGIWGPSSSEVFAVGRHGAIHHFDGVQWLPMTSGTQFSLVSIWGSSGDDVWAVGGDFEVGRGVVLHYDGAAWSEVVLAPPFHIWRQVAGRGPDDVSFVGSNGVFHFDGESWTPVEAPFAFSPLALSVVDSRETLFVGQNGQIATRYAIFTGGFESSIPCAWTRMEPAWEWCYPPRPRAVGDSRPEGSR